LEDYKWVCLAGMVMRERERDTRKEDMLENSREGGRAGL
jgi:hypothetical protein